MSLSILCSLSLLGCQDKSGGGSSAAPVVVATDSAVKLSDPNCADPDLSMIPVGVTFTLCNGQMGAGQLQLKPGDIRSGVVIANVTGEYPSAKYPFTDSEDGFADLTQDSFTSLIRSSASFEYWDSTGKRHQSAGNMALIPANIRKGIKILGVTGIFNGDYVENWDLRAGRYVNGTEGTLQVDCRNLVGSYNNSSTPAVAGVDVWDTIDDYNNGLLFPAQDPWNAAQYSCNMSNTWEDVTIDGCTNANITSKDCSFRDKVTRMVWSEELPAGPVNWLSAITACEDLTYDDYMNWRLPTQKELMAAYVHGIHGIGKSLTAFMSTDPYWSSTTVSTSSSFDSAWSVALHKGATAELTKSSTAKVICVRD